MSDVQFVSGYVVGGSVGYVVSVRPDLDPISPREDCNLGIMVCNHRRYNLGDCKLPESIYQSWVGDLYKYLVEGYNPVSLDDDDDEDEISEDEMISELGEEYLVLPLSIYDHGGITMYIGQGSGWDSGQVGYIYASHEDIKKEFGVSKITPEVLEKAEKILVAEVEEYDRYLQGEFYEFVIKKDGEVVGGCGGFDDEEVALKEGIAMAKSMA